MENILTFLHALFRAVKRAPFFISHLITGRCNCRCLTCKWRNTTPDGNLSDIISFYRRAKELGFYATTLWGGEPLIREDIFEIVKEIKRLNFKIGLITNGYFLCERLDITNYLDFLIVSIDAVEKTLDELRGVEGLYRRIIDGIRIQGCKRLMINTVVSDFSYPDCLKVIDLARMYNCPIFFEYPIGDNLISKKTAQEAFLSILRLKKRGYPIGNSNSYLLSATQGRFKYSCRARDFSITIDNGGYLKNCITGKIIGNVYKEDLQVVLNREEYKNLRRMSRHCHRCTDSGAYESSRTAQLKMDAILNSIKIFTEKVSKVF
ncbi:MAG: radical SAM protein [candidate division WOR-3 bacterium]